MTAPDTMPEGAVRLTRVACLIDNLADVVLDYDWLVSPVSDDDCDFPQHPNVEFIALPLAAFHALAAKAARADSLATALGESRKYVDGANMCGNLLSQEYATKMLAKIDALLDAAGGKGGG